MKIALAGLVVATIVYNAFIGFAVWFTIAFFGAEDLMTVSVGALIFWLMAASPLLVTGYCINRVQAFKRGERPRI